MSVPANFILANATGQAGLDAETALANAGIVKLYDSSDVLLGTGAALANPAFNAATINGANAQATLATANQVITISQSGTVAYGVLFASNGSTEVMRGPAGQGSGVFQLNNLAVVSGVNGTLTGITWSLPLHA